MTSTDIAIMQSRNVATQIEEAGFVEIVISDINLMRGTAEQINSLDEMLELLIANGYTVEKIKEICKRETVFRITKETACATKG